jgi:MtN3 and saliva related transmembrane protein
VEWLGWLAATILVITLFVQVKKNWQEKKLKGINPLLYWGQAAASLLFALYSLSINSWVFVVANAVAMISAMVGIYLVYRYR